MNCKRAMKSLLQLDNHQAPDGAVLTHLYSCARCKAEYNRLQSMITALRPDQATFCETNASSARIATHAPENGLSERIMAAVRLDGAELAAAAEAGRERAASRAGYAKWLASGTLILFGMVTLPYSAVVNYLRQLPGSRIDVTLAVAFGLILSAFMGAFIASHLEHLSRLLRRDSAS